MLLANFPAKSRKSSARQWLPRVRPWLEAIAKTLFLTTICDRIYLLTLWLGIFSRSFAQGLSLLSSIGGSQPTLCSGYKEPGVGGGFWNGGSQPQVGHPAGTLSLGYSGHAEYHPQCPTLNG